VFNEKEDLKQYMDDVLKEKKIKVIVGMPLALI